MNYNPLLLLCPVPVLILFDSLGTPIVAELGGLHSFMNWNRNLLTDSGGFQMVNMKFSFICSVCVCSCVCVCL